MREPTRFAFFDASVYLGLYGLSSKDLKQIRKLVDIDALLDEYTNAQVARILNEQQVRTGNGDPFDTASIKWVRY